MSRVEGGPIESRDRAVTLFCGGLGGNGNGNGSEKRSKWRYRAGDRS